MYYGYEFIEVKKKGNKGKNLLLILLVLIAIGGAIYTGIKTAEYANERKIEEARVKKQELQKEQKRIEEEKRQQEELKNSKDLTQEQIQAIENIYASEEKRVFLTFDDGPTTAVTPYILDLLKQENIKATFFVLGNRAKANPDLIKREFNEGHYIANHGYTHKYSSIYTNAQTVLEEYNYTEQCIQEALANPNYHSRIFRFPGGSVGGYYKTIKKEAKKYLRDNNIASLDWNSLTKDAEGAHTKETLLENAITTMDNKNSVVILMHDAADKILTYETLPSLIQYLRENGYEFKNLYDII